MRGQILDIEAIKFQAREELEHNWTGSYYAPHLDGAFMDNFLWDTCFIARALADEDPLAAATQLVQFTRHQWANGMFANQNGTDDRPLTFIERLNFWTAHHDDAPDHGFSSGFSQPPMIAPATLAVAEKLDGTVRERFLELMIPSIVKYHEWLFGVRAINGDGLATQIHPYETGMDNTPPYEELVMDSRTKTERILTSSAMMGIFGSAIGALRRDFKYADPDQRMHNASVAQYQLLTRKLAGHGYELDSIIDDPTIPLVEDVAYNSILVRANHALRELAQMARVELPAGLEQQIDQQTAALDQLWDDEASAYFSRNARTKELLKTKTIGSLMPLYAQELPKGKRLKLVGSILDPYQFWTENPLPSVPRTPAVSADGSTLYDPRRYWAGSTWLWMNSFIIDGLEQNNQPEVARMLLQKTLGNIASHHAAGSPISYEYFDPETGEGLGVKPFAPAAAVITHLANLQQAQAS